MRRFKTRLGFSLLRQSESLFHGSGPVTLPIGDVPATVISPGTIPYGLASYPGDSLALAPSSHTPTIITVGSDGATTIRTWSHVILAPLSSISDLLVTLPQTEFGIACSEAELTAIASPVPLLEGQNGSPEYFISLMFTVEFVSRVLRNSPFVFIERSTGFTALAVKVGDLASRLEVL